MIFVYVLFLNRMITEEALPVCASYKYDFLNEVNAFINAFCGS